MNDRGAKFEFNVSIADEERVKFAELSGDWNPLHTNEQYAQETDYKSCILHGAYSAALLSRMAWMVYPGETCLLHGMQLKFNKPVLTPITVRVVGEVVRDNGYCGEVKCRIENSATGTLLVEGSYQFGRHAREPNPLSVDIASNKARIIRDESPNKTIITGSSGALGAALLDFLGDRAIPLSYKDLMELDDQEVLNKIKSEGCQILNIVHCGWPDPNNVKLTELTIRYLHLGSRSQTPLH